MKDMMMEIYNALKANTVILEKVGSDRIKFYELVETFDTTKPFIIIDALVPQEAAYFASNKVLSKKFSYQINVESENALVTKEIAKAVEITMRENGFGQLTGGLDNYFKDTNRYVDARRYRKNTNIYDTDY